MGTITPAVHYHRCPTCGADWPHRGYQCESGPNLACDQCQPKAPSAQDRAKEAVSEMAEKMRNLHDPTRQIVKLQQALARQGLKWSP